jgi:chromosome segregation ATPase
MSKETTQEASGVHAKQLQHDRKVAELELTISKLQREKSRNATSSENLTEAQLKANDQEMSNQVKVLSEELMRLREKTSNQNSESLALKSRLQTAINRASKAEEELVMASAEGNDGIYDSMEQAKGNSGLGRRRKGGAPPSGSIRSVMRLNPGQGERTERIGKVIDVVDSFAATTGKIQKVASN